MRPAFSHGGKITIGLIPVASQPAAEFAAEMDDRDATENYDAAGRRSSDRFPGVRWPDVAIDAGNLERLLEGLLDAHLDVAQLAWGEAGDGAVAGEPWEEAWRLEAMQARLAPEGLMARAAFTVRVELRDPKAGDEKPIASEEIGLEAEVCLSFVSRHHTRPFLDFMGGEVTRRGDGFRKRLDPFALELTPELALAWGLNGTER